MSAAGVSTFKAHDNDIWRFTCGSVVQELYGRYSLSYHGQHILFPQPFPHLRNEETVRAKSFSTCPFGLESKCNGRKKRGPKLERKMDEHE